MSIATHISVEITEKFSLWRSKLNIYPAKACCYIDSCFPCLYVCMNVCLLFLPCLLCCCFAGDKRWIYTITADWTHETQGNQNSLTVFTTRFRRTRKHSLHWREAFCVLWHFASGFGCCVPFHRLAQYSYGACAQPNIMQSTWYSMVNCTVHARSIPCRVASGYI